MSASQVMIPHALAGPLRETLCLLWGCRGWKQRVLLIIQLQHKRANEGCVHFVLHRAGLMN